MAVGELYSASGLRCVGRPAAAIALGIGMLLGSLVSPVQASEEARMWLKRMSEASKTLNYEGTFVYRHGAHMESVRIIHRRHQPGG